MSYTQAGLNGKELTRTSLGNTGLKVSRVIVGAMSYGSSKWQPWVLDEEPSLEIIKKAYDLGINFFDTASTCFVIVPHSTILTIFRHVL